MDQNKKIPATIRMLTLNSSKTLRRALESVKDFEEILIFDGNSTDNTLDIAKEYGARIEKQYPDRDEPNVIIQDWAEVVNRVFRAASFDWVFYIDSDETASPGLIEEIRQIVADPQIKRHVYQVPNKLIYKGKVIQHAISYPGYQDRFFNKKADVHYEDSPHYFLAFDHKKYSLGTLKNPWYVHIDDDDVGLKLNFVKLTAMKDKDQTWWQFLRWSVFNKLFGIVKIALRAAYMYGRYGFKDSIPPKFVLAKMYEKLVLFLYLMRQRFIGPLKIDKTQKDKQVIPRTLG